MLKKAIRLYAKSLLIALLALMVAACESNDSKPNTFTVTFKLNNDSPDATQTVEAGKNATEPQDPIRDGHTFVGWYSDETLNNAFDFDTRITKNTILYAKWRADNPTTGEKTYKFWIPDANFRDTLKTIIPTAFDAEDSLLIQHTAVTERTSLNVNSSNIADLTGIEYFTSLTQLFCSDNLLRTLDMSQNTKLNDLACDGNRLTLLSVLENTALTSLNCSRNRLTALSIPQNTALTELNCYENLLTALDVSQNTALTELNGYKNQLKTLNVSQNTSLKELNCSENELTRLDVSNTVLEHLDCHDNLLTALDVSQNADLTTLHCARNKLAALDVSKNTALTRLYCGINQLTELDIRGMRLADSLAIDVSAAGPNVLNTIKVHESLQNHEEIKEAKTRRRAGVIIETYSAADGSADYTLECPDYDPNAEKCIFTPPKPDFTVTFDANEGSEVPTQTVQEGQTAERPQAPTRPTYTFLGWFTDDTTLQDPFDFDTPIIADLKLYAWWEQNPDKFQIPDKNFRDTLKAAIPTAFDSDDNLLTQHADVKLLTTLEIASLSIDDLKGIEYFTALTMLDCSGNQLTTLDLMQNTALTVLNCYNNQLTALEVSKNTKLLELRCYDNPISTLNVSQNTDLLVLVCYDNGLTTLDVSQNTVLSNLDCKNNLLTNLELSKNTVLTSLQCSNNQLMTLDVSQNVALTALLCSSNTLSALNVSKNVDLMSLYCSNNQLTTLNVSQNTSLTELDCSNNQLTDLDIRGMQSASTLAIDASATANPLDTLRVRDNLQDHAEIKRTKTTRGDALTIETYSADPGSTDYTLVCLDYDPRDGARSCNKAAP